MNVGGITTPSGSGSFARGVEIIVDVGGELEEDEGSLEEDADLELGAAITGTTSATTGGVSAAGVRIACGG